MPPSSYPRCPVCPDFGGCPRCLGRGHPLSECRNIRCLRYHFFGHITRNCDRPRSPTSLSVAPPSKGLRASSPLSSTTPVFSGSGGFTPVFSEETPVFSGSGGLAPVFFESPVLSGSSRGSMPLFGSSLTIQSSAVPAVTASPHPSLPGSPISGNVYVVSHVASAMSSAVESVEAALQQRELIVLVAGTRSGVSCEDVAALLRAKCHMPPDRSPCTIAVPMSFSSASRTSLTEHNCASAFRYRRFRLLIHPWSNCARSEPVTAHLLVYLQLGGIPHHARERATGETLLSPFCDIDELTPESANMFDMSAFRLFAWMLNPDMIPRLSELLLTAPSAAIARADPGLVFRFGHAMLRFSVSICVSSSEDYHLSATPPSSHASGGNGGAGGGAPPSR